MFTYWPFLPVALIFVIVGGLSLAFFAAQRPGKRKFPKIDTTKNDD